MRIDIITLFPEMFPLVLENSIVGRARRRGHLQVCCHQPFARGLDALKEHLGYMPHTIYMSPRGRVLDQKRARELSAEPGLILLCGHYEGVDQRLLDEYGVEEISIGDFVLTGGELPAMILTDAVSRMLPGVLSEDVCFEEESHFGVSPVHKTRGLAGA